jgi:hypothetical protein
MSKTVNLTEADCIKWMENKKKNPKNPKNPITNYKIEKDSKKYNEIESKCIKILSEPSNDSSPIIPKVQLPKTKKKELKVSKEICDKWTENKKKNPTNPKNPITGYKISNTSAIYKDLDTKCDNIDNIQIPHSISPKKKSKTGISSPLNLEQCLYWEKHKTKNPKTKYTLSENSKILKEIKKQCEEILKDFRQKPKEQQVAPIPQKPEEQQVAPIPHKPKEQQAQIPQKPEEIKHIKDDLYYPSLDDEHFREKLIELDEYKLYKVPPYDPIKTKQDLNNMSIRLCADFEKTLYQYFVSNYISTRTPYKSILLYHGVGVGKTCSAITLAEGFLTSHSVYNEPKIWVIMPKSLKNSFKEQIFSLANFENFEYLTNQCTGDLYMKMVYLLKDSNKERIQSKIKKFIQSRYKIFTYESFATFIENEYIAKNKTVKDKVIIVDEAHNIRSMNEEKRVYTTLTNVLEKGVNNRCVLLSATPMYNTPEDIYDLLYLLVLNDKRKDILKEYPYPPFFNNNKINEKALRLIEKLASNYISYLKGKNPFTFATKLSPLPSSFQSSSSSSQSSSSSSQSSNINILTHEFKYDSNDKKILDIYKGWLTKIRETGDNIILSNLSKKQKEYITKSELGDENNVFNNLQPMNIVYDDTIGEKGFSTFFTRTDDKNTMLNVKYNKKYINSLYPDQEHLGKYSGKILNICNIIKNTQGIVVIYSGYIWSGIVPIAVALEHMGFQREGANNILHKADIIPNRPNYTGIKNPKYCIMTSDNNDIMGNTTIDGLLKIINSPKNIDGSQIKVILITPVAGEGLSFYNIREMHLVEPWFHFNRVTQIIGRGIRNCRHQYLPLEERNVSVYMHSSYDGKEKETTDIHAFRIAAHKYIQTSIIDKVIRDNAVDCFLMKNINYFPKSLFELGKIKIRTSQNLEIDYEFGDNPIEEPKCSYNVDTNDLDISDLHIDTYKHFIKAIQNKIRRIILNAIHEGEYYITFKKILNEVNFNEQIVYQSINNSVYPNILIDGYTLIPHNEGIHIISINPEKITKLRITYEEPVKEVQSNNKKCNVNKLNAIAKKNIDIATIALYMYLDSECFIELVKTLIESNVLSETDEFIANILYKEGALIGNNEIRSIKTDTPTSKYIGYVNIFNDKKFEGIVYVNGKYRDMIEREEAELFSRRQNISDVSKPNDMTHEKVAWGIITPVLDKKTNIYKNVFKLLTAGSSVGKKTGIVCSSLQKKSHDDILNQMGIRQNLSDTKENSCIFIAQELLKINRISIIPEYKPI